MKILQLIPYTILLTTMLLPTVANAICLAPTRPYVPSDPVAAAAYPDLIKADFETYFREAQAYFRCVDEERARTFLEAAAVSESYAKFLREVNR
jgi:hypothetical protein